MLYTLIKITHLLLICNTGRIVLKLVTLDLGMLNYIFRLHISNFCWHKWQTYVSEAVAWWPPGYLHFCIGTSVWHQGISERTMLIAWVKIFIIPCHPDCRGNGTIKWFVFLLYMHWQHSAFECFQRLQDLAQLQEATQCLIGYRESGEIDPEAFSRLIYVARSIAAFRPTHLVLFAEKYFLSTAQSAPVSGMLAVGIIELLLQIAVDVGKYIWRNC